MRITILLVLLGLLACAKPKVEPKDGVKPEIIIQSPDNHSHYKQGDTIHYAVTFTDDESLFKVKFNLTDEYTGKVLVDTAKKPIGPYYTIFYDYPVKEDTSVKRYIELIVSATDDAGNTTQGYKFHSHVNE